MDDNNIDRTKCLSDYENHSKNGNIFYWMLECIIVVTSNIKNIYTLKPKTGTILAFEREWSFILFTILEKNKQTGRKHSRLETSAGSTFSVEIKIASI
jgi:hypothetical protein